MKKSGMKEAAGLWKGLKESGLEYERRIRARWRRKNTKHTSSASFFGALKMLPEEAEEWKKRIRLDNEKTSRESRGRGKRVHKRFL